MIHVSHIAPADPDALVAAFAGTRWARAREHFARHLDEQQQERRVTFVARLDDTVAGHASLVWTSGYAPFREQGIPEVQDLNVAPQHRGRGVALALLDAAEREAAKRSTFIGIGVGLHAAYGPAQRLYVLRGYVPDGRGVFRHGEPVREAETTRLDDDLVLYLTKRL
jgi:GNAT superfamily N-acetyltransferase